MKSWNLVFRRVHLYLGLLLIPWMLVYALSTFFFNHRERFEGLRAPDPQWFPLWEKDYALPALPAADNPAALREVAHRILAEHGFGGGFFARRNGPRLNINVQDFWHPRRLAFDSTTGKLRAEQKSFAWIEVLSRLHERTGYGSGGLLNNLWAFAVDVYCVTTLVWIATGLYLWWKLAAVRRWGWIAIGSGLATIIALTFTV
ncbi:MAG: PepSY-associated TM helix domain-containing protein [Opitutaceae bacterium]|nr:PepSY-associated TM helix domain-containing protein [Opitutaceae bacterium]